MIAALPRGVSLQTVLARMDALLNRVQPQRPALPVKTEKDLPPPQPAPAGEIRIVEYPHRNEQQPGSVWLALARRPGGRPRPSRSCSTCFSSNIAGDPTTNLYKRFIDSKTREIRHRRQERVRLRR